MQVKKIKEPVLEELIIECYDHILGKSLTRREMYETIVPAATSFLESRGYKLYGNKIKCDVENNPCTSIEIESINVYIFEEEFPGSPNHIYHHIIL